MLVMMNYAATTFLFTLVMFCRIACLDDICDDVADGKLFFRQLVCVLRARAVTDLTLTRMVVRRHRFSHR